ncbi:MAG TPA: methylated-DNA--[protein]-cysteine S-methyltransferase [Anaeromyxobacter sp.]|nr:methylated-DNA--[protein]-cysteine S-methyltransferase [Anaeromyxobacter sp.]
MQTNDAVRLAVHTPIGPLVLSLAGRTVRAARFEDAATSSPPAPPALAARLAAYFAGDLESLLTVPVDPGGTPFQRAVWNALRRIPPGEVRSYSALARELGRAGAARAVGAACARNPVALLVPCHRAVGKGGVLTGYAFGLERKRWLLDHEARGRGSMAGACSASVGPWHCSSRQ